MKKKIIFSIISVVFILLTTQNCFSAEVHLAWDSSFGTVTGYRVYYGTSPGTYSNMVEVGNATDYILTGLDETLTYYIVVRAYNDYGESGNSNEISWNYDAGSDPPPSAGGIIEAESGTLTSPMQTATDSAASGGEHIQTTTSNTGTATYTFNVEDSGTYKIVAMVYASSNASNSFFVQIDDSNEDIWDINPSENPDEYNVWLEDEITQRGNGTFDNPQLDPFTIELTQGLHTIILRGREANTRLDYIYLSRDSGSAPGSPPNVPSGLTIKIN